MSTTRKAFRYGLKKQELNRQSKNQGLATSMKLLRSVLAVGFAMTPFIGGREALAGNGIVRADGITLPAGLDNAYLQNSGDKTANIYAEQASGTTGLNRFKYFDVGAGQIANLYFQTGAKGATLNTLVNTVENQINISGTVNAVRNNKIGGNLYFLSRKGMVVGAGGVINAGSLTVIGAKDKFSGDDAAQKAAEAIVANNWDMDNDAKIEINGQINTMTGIDLRAAHIALKKASSGNTSPLLRTGAVFSSTVNTEGLYPVLADQKLTVVKGDNGAISFKDSSGNAADVNGATGDGGVKLTAEATQQNSCFSLFNIGSSDSPVFCNDTVEAKVDIGSGSGIQAAGDVKITATATRQNDNNPIEFWDLFTSTNAEINLYGNVSGQNVTMSAKATSSFTGSNNQSLFYVVDNRATQIINKSTGETVQIDINNSLTDAIMNTLLAHGFLGQKTQVMNNIVEQLYMPFSFVNAKASVNQGVDSVIKSTGDLNVNAESSASNKLAVAIQPKVVTGSSVVTMPVGGGFVYTETNSDATVNLLGKDEADGNLIAGAKSTNTSISSMVLKKARSIDDGSGNTGPSGNDYYALALAINVQDNNATVNLGADNLADKGSTSATRIKAGGGLNVNATTIDTVASTAVVGTSSDSILNTAINIVDSDGKAEINSYVPLQGAAVSFGATELLNGLTVTTDGSSGVELTGLDALISSATVKKGVQDTIGPFLEQIRKLKDNAAGSKVDLKTDGKKDASGSQTKKPSWNEYFSVGASLMVANVDNIAKINIAPGASITSTRGDVKLASKVTIGDSLLVTKNLLTNEKKSSQIGVSAAIAIEDMHNTAEVNVESSEEQKTSLLAAGSVRATAESDQSYNRLDKMVANLEKGWASAQDYWSKQGTEAIQEILPELQIAVADLLTITAKDSATDLSKSKQHTLKAKAVVDLLANVLGVDELKSAVEAFCNAANYTNMYVSSSTDKMDTPMAGDSTAMATGTVGIQNLDNNATVKIGSNAIITAGNEKLVQLSANSVEQSFLMAGKWAFLPDIYTTDAGAYGIGGTVGVQNASSNSLVQVMDGVQINAGAIDLATKNDVLNMSLVMGGARTSALGIAGMLSYQGGDATAQTLVDDDASLTALQKQVLLTTTNSDGSTSSEEYEALKLTADNDTIIIGVAGDLSSSRASAVGVSTSVVDYNVKSLAVMENQQTTDTEGRGLIRASDIFVDAHTGGVINSLSVAGSQNNTSNTNKQSGGASASTSGGKGANGVENIQAKASTNNNDNNNNANTTEETNNTIVQITAGEVGNNESGNEKATEGNSGNNAGNKKPEKAQKNPVVDLKAAGSVSVNYIVDETRAGIDNIDIEIIRPTSGSDVTTNLQITAEDDSYIGAYSGAGALTKQGVDYQNNSKFSSLINGAVAFNEINKTTSATLKNSTINNVDNVLNQSENSGAQVALGLALGVDLAQRMDNFSVNLGASGSFNFVDSTVKSLMDNASITGSSCGSLNVNNTAYDKDVQVAGGASAEYAGSAALGASVAVNEATNNILAQLQNTTIGSQAVSADSINNLAVSNLVQVGGAISVGVTTGSGRTYAVGDVAVATNVLENQVQAEASGVNIYASAFANEARDGKLKADEKANKYVAEINSAPNTAIQVDVAYYQDGAGLSVVRNLNGEYVYEATGEKVPAGTTVTQVEGTGTGKYYVLDENNTKQYIVLNEEGQFVYEGTTTIVDINAPVSQNIIDLDVDAALTNANGSSGVDFAVNKNADGSVNEEQRYTSQNITVNDSGNVIVGSAIGVAVKTGGSSSSAGVAAATSVNYVTNSFNASVTGGTLNMSGSDGVSVKAESNTVMVAVAAGAAATVGSSGLVTVDVAGSGVANTINNETVAKVENSTITAPKLAVDATTNSTLVGVAGQLSTAITENYGGVAGLTWAQNDYDNITGAYVRGITLQGYNSANTGLYVNAYNNSDMYTVSAGVGVAVADGAAVGAYAANYGTNSTEAVVGKYTDGSTEKKNALNNVAKITVQAKDDSDLATVAGSLGVAVSKNPAGTVGGAVANTQIGSGEAKQRVWAALNDAEISMVAGADLSVQALNDANVASFALGGGVAVNPSLVGVSVEGSVSIVDVHTDSLASMNNTNVFGSNNEVELLAQSDGDIVSSADAVDVAFGGVSGVASGAAVSVLNSDADTKAEVKNTAGNSTWNVKNALVQSQAHNDIFNLAMGIGVGTSETIGVGVEGNVAVNNISNDATVDVEGMSITASESLGILAQSQEHLQNYGGAVSVGAAGTAGVGVGATVVVNTISGSTLADVNNSNLAAAGGGNGITVKDYTVAEDGSVSTTEKQVKGIVVNADSKHELDNVTVSSSIGGAGVAAVGVGVTADVNEISGETKAAISNSDINKGQNSVGDVHVLAHDAADISADVVNIDIGGSGVASVAALGTAGTNIISRDTSAVIDGDTSTSGANQKVLNANSAKVYALGERKLRESVTGVGIAASAEGAATAAANVSVIELSDDTLAKVQDVAGSVHSLQVDAERVANVHSYNNVITLTGAIGTINAGCGVTVFDDKSGTQAQLINGDFTRRGNKDSSSKITVLANNKTKVETELSVPQLGISLGGVVGVAVEVVNMESGVGVTVDDVSLGDANNAYTSFNALANNKLTNKFTNANTSASSLGGAMVGVGDVNINSQTFTSLDNVTAYADTITVGAYEDRSAHSTLVAANVAGSVTIGVNLMYINIGDELENSYTYYRGDDAKTGVGQTGTDSTASVQAMVNSGLTSNKAVLTSLEENSGAELTYTGTEQMNTGASAQEKVGLATSVTGNSKLQATNALAIDAAATNDVYSTLEQVQVSIGEVAVASNRVSVVEHQSLLVENAALSGNTVAINSENASSLGGSIGTVPISVISYTDTTGYIKHSGNNTVTVLGSQLEANKSMTEGSTEIPLGISASNSTTIDNLGHNVTVTGAGGGRMILEGEDASTAAVNLGNTTTNSSLKAAKIVVQAQNNPHVKNEATIVDTGVLVGSGNIITSKVSGGANLTITDKNAFNASEVDLLALSGSSTEDNKYTTEATAHNVSVTMGDITVNKVRTYNEMETGITLGAAKFLNGSAFSDVSLRARNLTDSYAYIHTTNVASGAGSGNNFAYTNANDQVHISVDGGTEGIVANNLSILAENTADVTARAVGTEAGTVIISPYTARVGHSSNSETDVTLNGNLEAKGALTVNAQRNDTVNLKADALTVTLDGGGDAHVDSSITSSTGINVNGDNEKAVLKSGNDMLLQANNSITMNRDEDFFDMLWGQGYGATAIDTAGINNTVVSTAKVLLKNADLVSTNGGISLSGYTNEDLLVNGYVFSVGLVGGSITNVNNTITNTEAVELENSSIKTKSPGKAITLSAADDLKLFTYALTETPAGAIGGSNADLTDRITRTNTIALKNSGNSLYSTQDVNLYAGKKLDGSVATFDLDAEAKNYNGNIIPVVLMPTVENIVNQNNSVTIAANSSSNSVRHTNIYADAGQELTRVLAARDTGYGGTSNGGYVTEASGDEKYEKISNNKVDINGSVTAGSGNVIYIKIGESGDIAVFDADDRDALTGVTALDEAGLRDKITIEADPITGITEDTITLGRANYTLFLLNRYNEVMKLMDEYAKDGSTLDSDSSNAAANAAYLGYKAEAERLREEMLANGGIYLDSDGKYHLVNAQYVDYVEIPSLTASGGNINIQADTLTSSSKSGSMLANGSADIDIINNTNLLLKLNEITVESDGGKLVYNGQVLKPNEYTTEALNEQIKKLNETGTSANFASIEAKAGDGSDINIEGNYSGLPLNYTYQNTKTTATGTVTETVTGHYTPMADIWVQKNINNLAGSVSITSDHNNIRIAGSTAADAVAISGKTVALSAGGSITQSYTDGIVSVGGSVESIYGSEFSNMQKNGWGQTNIDIKETGPQHGEMATGSYIAGGSIYINASDINVNGVIQSGYGDYYLDMTYVTNGEGKAVDAKIAEINKGYTQGTVISDEAVKGNDAYKVVDGGAYWDRYDGCYEYKLNAYYNPYTNKIIVEDVNASGGKIYLTGRIVSTGAGKIICLDGTSNIDIQNATSHVLQVGNLLTHDVEGVISITDTAGYTVKKNGVDTPVTVVSTIKKNSTDVKYLTANGEYITPDSGTAVVPVSNGRLAEYDYAYNPKSGLRYTWTEGEQSTEYRRYKKDVMYGGWGLWSRSEEQQLLASWSVEENFLNSGSYSGETRLPNIDSAVIEDKGDTSKTHMDYSSESLDNFAYTVESDEVYHSGAFGCHEHHVITWTESRGTLKTYHASVKADQTIDIKFIGYDASLTATSDSDTAKVAQINIDSSYGVDIDGSIGNTQVYKNDSTGAVTERGIIKINSMFGAIEQNSGSLYGAGIELLAAQGIKDINIVAGDNVALTLLNIGAHNVFDASITLDNAVGAKGNLALVTADSGSTGGNTWKTLTITNNGTQGDIWKTSDNAVAAGRINLTTVNGSIYGSGGIDTGFAVNVGQTPADGDSLSASLNASAYGNINIKQSDGDLRLGRVYSKTGNVTLEATNGSIIDALPNDTSNKGTAEERIARWKSLGMIGGEGSNETLLAIKNRLIQAANAKNNGSDILSAYEQYDVNALLYTVSESIVNPDGSNLTKTSSKDPNVIGHNITLVAGKSVGYDSGTAQDITLTGILKKDTNGNYVNVNAVTQLQTLANADITNVSVKTDARGNAVASVQDKQAVGVQQITSLANPENGKLTVSAGGKDDKGYILLAGREEVGNDSFIGIDNKGQFNNLYVNTISSTKGEVNLTSLGGIYNNAVSGAVNIAGKSLYITAVDALGTASKMLTTDIFGTNKTTDGLSAVAGGNIYLNQTSDNNLILRNVSSSKTTFSTSTEGGSAGESSNKKEIYLGANKSILMGTNGTSEDYYLRADGLELTIEARGGSIGEAISSNIGVIYTDNDGVRIKNVDAADTASKVVLKAKDNVYVKGLTSSSMGVAAQGQLNLEVAPVTAGVTPANVGIVVDGNLHLLDALNSSSSASVYTTTDLTLDNNSKTISSSAVYLGSLGNVVVDGTNAINGTDSVNIHAGQNVKLQSGTLSSAAINLHSYNGTIEEASSFVLNAPVVNANAAGTILLDSKINQLQQVNVANTSGSITVGSGNTTSADLHIAITTPDAVVGGDLTVHNYDAGNDNNIVLADKLQATGTISIINEEANVTVGADGDISAKNISLQANNNDIVMSGGKLTAAEKVQLEGVNVTISGGAVKAAEAKLTAVAGVNMSGGSISADTATLVAGTNISMTGGSISADSASFTTGTNIAFSDGSITADTTVLTATGGAITESDGFKLDTALVKAKAAGAISLASQINQLANVLVANNSGDVIIYNGNITNKNLNIAILNEGTEGAKVNGSLSVHNYNNNNGLANKIVLNKQLNATGDISLINDEADITVSEGAALSAQNITLQADNNAVVVDGGSLTATSENSEAGVVTLDGNSVHLKSGTITAKTTNLTSDTTINENEDFVLVTPVLNTSANGITDLKSTANQLEQVNIEHAGGSVTISSTNRNSAHDLAINTAEAIQGNLHVINNADSSSNKNEIVVASSLQASGTITLTNQEAAINVANTGSINAKDVVLTAVGITVDGNIAATNDVSLNSDASMSINGSATATNATTLNAAAITVNGTVNTTNGMTTLTAASDNLTLQGSGDVSGQTVSVSNVQDFNHNGSTISGGSAVINAASNVNLQGGSIQATDTSLTAGTDIGLVSGSIISDTAELTATSGKITENNGYVVNAGVLNVAAGQGIAMSSEANKLKNVVIDNAGDSVTIVSSNDVAGDLNVSTAESKIVNGNINVTNVAAGSALNEIVVDKALQASGNITLVNNESDINVNANALVAAANIILQADGNAVNFNGGSSTTTATNGKLEASGSNIRITGSEIDAAIVETTATNDLVMSGGSITAIDVTITAGQDITQIGGVISATDATMTASQDITQIGGVITATNANLKATQNITQTAGSIVAANTTAEAGNTLSLARITNKLQNVSVKAE
ncbi:MAG: hypothetical protein SOV56_05940, partial [Phascolarctobacterium sp.]|nr:hypothetical protein [Phascolarctobacterium sp.]